jgi:hypothetical protein
LIWAQWDAIAGGDDLHVAKFVRSPTGATALRPGVKEISYFA